jgi:hypothetical protein
MRYRFALMAMVLPVTGCYAPPPPPYGAYGYPQPAYPQPGYPQPLYPSPGYPSADFSYPGFAYYEGSPTIAVGGAVLPLIFLGGAWGYYDRDHSFHRAPDSVAHHLEGRYPGGSGYRPWAGPAGRPGGFAGTGYPGGFHPNGPPAGGPPPAGPPPGGQRPGGVPPAAAGFFPRPVQSGGQPPPNAYRPTGTPPGGGSHPAHAQQQQPQRHRDDRNH